MIRDVAPWLLAAAGVASAAHVEKGRGSEQIEQQDGRMRTARYVHWQDQGMWLGYLEAHPDYLTQGESLKQLQENLRDLYADLANGEIPGIRKLN